MYGGAGYLGNRGAALPPPPPRDRSLPPTLQRQTAVQPPWLTTTFPTGPNPTYAVTPHSTTSLFSPFSQNSTTLYTPSPGGSRGVSPAAPRLAMAYNVAYNPGEWASGEQRVAQPRPGAQTDGALRLENSVVVRSTIGADGAASPPPPYSPPSDHVEGFSRASLVLSPLDTIGTGTETSQVNIPTANSRLVSPIVSAPLRPAIVVALPTEPPMLSVASSQSVHGVSGRHVSRPSSRMSYLQTREDESLQAPAARRAVSMGTVPSVTSFNTYDAPGSRSSSKQRSWQPGMPLPGPPVGPPPASSRSQSASSGDGKGTRPSGSGQQSFLHRVPLRGSTLGPVPPTPAGWTEEGITVPTTRSPLRLHIDTSNPSSRTNQAGSSKSRIESGASAEESTEPTPSSLNRSDAKRDPSVKGIWERRTQSKTRRERLSTDLAALSLSKNPWDNATAAVSGDDDTSARTRGKQALLRGDPGSSSPPRSPAVYIPWRRRSAGNSAGIQSRALPTPPLSQKAPQSAHSIAPSTNSSAFDIDQIGGEDKSRQSLRRHQAFLRMEKAALDDVERLNVFAEYILAEASLRRDLYKNAFTNSSFDAENVRAHLFAESPLAKNHARSSLLNQESEVTALGLQDRPESTWWKDYQPALSPIASMSHDELSSRGRAPSRWFESHSNSQSDGAAHKVKRSKRESKYMGLPNELLQSGIFEVDTTTGALYSTQQDDCYPDEKADPHTFGFYDDHERATPRPRRISNGPSSPALLDISRFVTLPPPYPRHHPAVNNSHPRLVGYRNLARSLSDMSDLRDRKARHTISAEALRGDTERRLVEGRRTFKANIQAQIGEGNLSYAEAAEAEEALKLDEREQEKQCLKAEFDTLQDVVINPLYEMLKERLTQLDASITELKATLRAEAEAQDFDRPQQEGDETPEVLEYLTQTKWLFEIREAIHKELFDLMTERNDKYKAMVVLPYRHLGNMDKVRNTEAFFAQDNLARQTATAQESLSRHESILSIVEDHVSRAVQEQSSAFWDIAPGLLDLLQKIPEDLEQLEGINIPEQEYEENPSYYDHPQQYLYSLLGHAEKSTYQFIESQTNLHCLLHEVKTSAAAARSRLLEAQMVQAGKGTDQVSRLRSQDEAVLTAELKQKVATNEEQWLEALGSQLQMTRKRVKLHLQQEEGWEDLEESDG